MLVRHKRSLRGLGAGRRVSGRAGWLQLDPIRWAFSLGLALVLATAAPVAANHRGGVYGEKGFRWLARYTDYASIWVVSNKCSRSTREEAAWTRVKNSTAGTSEFAGRWPSGLEFVTVGCERALTGNDDIKIKYSDWDLDNHSGASHPGEHHPVLAPSSFCEARGAPYPCGMHLNKVHINEDRWLASSGNFRERLLMHETGHAMGLKHHCISNSIMNDGWEFCNGGAWTSVMEYQPTDRAGVRDVYPGWRYP